MGGNLLHGTILPLGFARCPLRNNSRKQRQVNIKLKRAPKAIVRCTSLAKIFRNVNRSLKNEKDLFESRNL